MAAIARTRVLAVLVVIGAIVAGGLWLIRLTPVGQPGPLGTPLPSDAGSGGWRQLPDAPIARLEMATAVHRDQLWLAGGLEADGAATAAVSVFDPASGTWTDGPELPVAVHHASLVSDGERLVLIGGNAAPTFGQTDAVWLLEPGAAAWSPGPPLPAPRGAGAAAFDGERIVFGGGVGPDGAGPSGTSDAVFALDGGAWSEVGRLSRPREHLAAASDGEGATWFLGGRQGGLETNVGDVDLVVGEEVRPLPALSPRGGVAAFFLPRVGACLTGGEALLRASTLVECVDASGRVLAPPSMSHQRHGHGAGVIGGTAYVLLGGPTPGLSVHSSIEAIDIDIAVAD